MMSRHSIPAGMRNEGNDEDEEVVPVPVPYFRRYDSQVVARQISFYLSGEIGPAIAYTDLLNALSTASEYDVIFLHLNTPGGIFDTGLQIINNIQACKAKVITVLEARAYSMGSLIFLAGDELIVHDNCQLMFHNYSGSLIGKGNEQHAQVIAHGKWFDKVMHRLCYPFLSSEELEAIMRGADIWMDSDEIRRRMQKVIAARQLPAPPRAARGKKAEATTPPVLDAEPVRPVEIEVKAMKPGGSKRPRTRS